MKTRIYLIIIMGFIFTNCYSNDFREIKKSVFDFLVKTEDYSVNNSVNDILNELILEVKTQKPLSKKNTIGIFIFSPMAVHGHSHFILAEKDTFQIINMRETFEDNIKKLIDFFKRNEEYNKDDVIFYMSFFLRINDNNQKNETARYGRTKKRSEPQIECK